MAEVKVAEAALERTYLGILDEGILHADSVPGPLLDPEVHVRIGPNDILELPVLGTGLLHDDLPLFVAYGGGNDCQAFGAEALGGLREPFRN